MIAFQQELWSDPDKALLSQVAGAPSNPYVLYTDGVDPEPGGLLSEVPRVHAHCDDVDFTQVMMPYVTSFEAADMSPALKLSVDKNSPESHQAARVFMTAQRCVEFLSSTAADDIPQFERAPGVPWIGYDGMGATDVTIRMRRNTHGGEAMTKWGAYWSPIDLTINFYPGEMHPLDMPFEGASIETVCHEMAHGVFHHISPGAANLKGDLEASALEEGFGDILGSAAEMSVRVYPGIGAWCFAGDEFENTQCLRNLAYPFNSKVDAGCQIKDKLGNIVYDRCPTDYRGPDYCAYQNMCQPGSDFVECCDPHANSTVLSHWFYTLANGASGVNSSSCSYFVPQLDPQDLPTSVAQATRILFTAVRDYYYPPNANYEGMADATISAAEALYGPDSPQADAVKLAWFAANVKQESELGAGVAEVEPAREQQEVYPWTTFAWPIPASEHGPWEFEISVGPFAGSTLLYSTDATETDMRNGMPVGVLPLALPFEDSRRYFWRVRPQGADSWDCYPIHSFVGTTHPGDVANIQVTGEIDPVTNLVRPGEITVRWDAVQGAKKYKLLASTTENPDCESGPEVIERTFDATLTVQPGDSEETTLDGIQPQEQYYLYVQPVGPPEFNHEPGKCVGIAAPFTTTKMRPPELDKPDFNDALAYGAPVHFYWTAPDGPETCRIQLFEMLDASGACDSNVALELVVPCPSPGLDLTFADLPNPPGYCWHVKSIAKNLSESAYSDEGSVRWGFHYYWSVDKLWPGVDVASTYVELNPAPLPNDSYGSTVTFRWEPDALGLAAGYHVKLGMFPWNGHPLAPPGDPGNCVGPSTLGCLGEPSEIVFDEVVQGNTKEFGPDTMGLASKGRYCWTVWPLRSGPRQPLVDIKPIYCYTSGPAPIPEIHVDNPPPDTGFVPDAITGHILFPFTPDGQAAWTWAATDQAAEIDFWMGDGCEPPALCPFDDYFDCHVEFSITPREGQGYQIHGYTYNSDVSPPTMDDTTLIDHRSIEIRTGFCGDETEPCCSGGECDGFWLVCDAASTCVECGMENEPCCEPDSGQHTSEWCRWDHLACDSANDKCIRCGLELGDPCCPEDSQYPPCSGSRRTCYEWANICGHCGAPGEPCCTTESPACDDGECKDNGWCPTACVQEGGACASKGDCCTGDCDPASKTCSSVCLSIFSQCFVLNNEDWSYTCENGVINPSRCETVCAELASAHGYSSSWYSGLCADLETAEALFQGQGVIYYDPSAVDCYSPVNSCCWCQFVP